MRNQGEFFPMNSILQVLAIARTEFRFSLRRSAPLVMTALISLIVGIGILVVPIGFLKDQDPGLKDFTPEQMERLAERGYTPESYRQLVSRFSADWSSASGALLACNLMSIALLLLPIATISAIPADRQFDVLEILRSTPITGIRYLAGKVLGVVTIVLLVGLISFLLFLVALEVVLFHFFHFGVSFNVFMFYFQLTVMDGLPLLACGSTIGVLAGVVFRTRRAALFPGLVIGVLSIYLWLTAFKAPHSIFPVTDVAAYYVLQNFRSDAISTVLKMNDLEGIGLLGEGASVIGIGKVILMYVLILVTFFILAILARLWLHWKENF
jgi:hypothetical protein